MRIQNMFHDDINRQINGVIKVDQDAHDVIEQEVKEYVITKELRKHFAAFFNYYSDAFDVPTADVGVWISGFFGSGKSHFLKILSYLLENKVVNGKTALKYFEEDEKINLEMQFSFNLSSKRATLSEVREGYSADLIAILMA